MNFISPSKAGAAAFVLPRSSVVARLVLCVALLVSSWAAHAQCDARLQCCATPSPGGNPGCDSDSPSDLPSSRPRPGTGNPVDIVTGNKYQRETDLPAMPGVLGLELVRHYNSAHSHRSAGRLGRGWRLSYQAELHAGKETLTIVQADGATRLFTRGIVYPDVFTSPDPQGGRVERFHERTGVHFIWTWPNGRRLRFEHGKLSNIIEPSGEFVYMTYAPDGSLMQVRDPQNRALILAYDRNGRLSTVDTPVGRFTYAYEGRPANLLKMTQPDGVTRTYHYEDARHPHALTGITAAAADGDGKKTTQRLNTWAYDDKGLAVSSVKGDGTGDVDRVTIQRRYTDEGGEATLTNSLGHATRYRWRTIAGQSRLVEVVGPGCSTCGPTNVRYVYDKRGRLIEVIRLDDQGRPAETTRHELDSLGRVVQTGRVAHVAGRAQPLQWLVRYRYASAQDRAPAVIARPSVVPGKEHTLRIARNGHGQPTEIVEEGFSPLDDKFQSSSSGWPLRRKTTYSYTPVHGRSLLTQVDGPLPNGPTGTPSDSDITRLHYDEGGDRIDGVTHPMGMKAQFQYDTRGRLVSQTPVDGIPVVHTLDSLGRVAEWKRGALHVKVQRDVIGRVRSVERNDGGRFTVHRDGTGRVVAVSDAQGHRREAKFDSEGRMLEAVARDASGQAPFDAQRVEYDAMGRPVAGSGGWRAHYDDHGRLQAVEDALNRQSRYHYDSLGRFVEHELRTPAEAAPSFLRTAHPPDGWNSVRTRLLHPDAADGASGIVAANGARTTSDVDDFGRTVRLSSPDTGVETARYDEADRLLERIDAAGNRTTVQYDLLGRILSRRTINPARPDEIDDARWTYRGTLLVESANRHQSDTYRWDDQHRLIEQITRLARMDGGSPSHEFVTRYSYDRAGRLSEKRLPDGLVVLHRYDVHGAPAGLALRYPNGKEQPIIESLKADPVHGLREVTFGNGVVTAYAKDRQGRVAGIVTAAKINGDSKPLYAQRLTYDAGGRITAIERNGAAESYAYDGQDRLVEVRTPHEHRRFSYDEVGNRTAVWQPRERVTGQPATSGAITPQQSLTYQPNSNRLLSIVGEQPSTAAHATAAFKYDATGNPILIGNRRHIYGVNGRLSEVTEPERAIGRYVYNAAGERVGKQAGGTTTHYLYANNQIIAEVNDHGRITTHYFNLGHAPIAKVETRNQPNAEPDWQDVHPSALQRVVKRLRRLLSDGLDDHFTTVSVRVLYVHADHIGTPRIATDLRQRTAWKATYDAFGAATPSEDPDGDGSAAQISLRLAGQIYDGETDTHYNYFRDYDPETGRYLQSDPIGITGGINTYGYAAQSPTSSIDPLGLKDYRIGNSDPRVIHDAGAGPYASKPSTLAWIAARRTALDNLSKLRWEHAKEHLEHYLGNTGTSLTIDVRTMLNEVRYSRLRFREELIDAIVFVESLDLERGACIDITSSSTRSITIPKDQSTDWFLAIGDYKAWGKATVRVDDSDYILMQFEYRIADRYNWDTGKSVNLGITIKDNDMGEFHRRGLAKEYDLGGWARKTIRWKKGASVPLDLINW